MPGVEIVPAILTRSVPEARRRIRSFRRLTPKLHLDLMDGQFVRNRSFGPDDLVRLRLPESTTAHLMVTEPAPWIAACSKAGIRRLVLHVESKISPRLVRLLRRRFTFILAVNPGTPISNIRPYWRLIDGLQIMTVRPGKQGSRFLSNQLKLLDRLHRTRPRLAITVDGGMNRQTAQAAIAAGAREIVVGAYLRRFSTRRFHRLKALVRDSNART